MRFCPSYDLYNVPQQNPSCDDRAGLRHRLLHLEHTLMSARGSLDDALIAIMDANDAAL